MQPFDLLNTPLEGVCLIEASAGTGKTYNIANLFLRLIVGHEIEQALEKTSVEHLAPRPGSRGVL